jgi:hypothetical protein
MHVNMEAVDISNVAVAVAGPDAVAAPAAAPVETEAPAAPKPDLLPQVDSIVADLSGATLHAGDLARYVPVLAAAAQKLAIHGLEKRELVIASAHTLVDRCLVEDSRGAAHTLVDAVFPSVIEGVLDVAKGRVSFEVAAAQAAAETAPRVQEVASGCVGCLKVLLKSPASK